MTQGKITGLAVAVLVAALALSAVACGGAQGTGQDTGTLVANLRRALGEPVTNAEVSAEHSRAAEAALEASAFEGKSREEVEALIGRGDDCSTHPRCAEQGFHSDDWHYDVGQPSDTAAPIPVLILGFDRTGRVERTWNLRTHD
jgi:hypothetical protein